jgi:hypothetical protein
MATLNLTCNHDARVAQSGGTNLGSGASQGLPFGLYGSYRYRTLLAFPFNFTGWTAINSATLWVRTSSQIHVGFGSAPTVRVQRMAAGGFTEGTSDGLSTGNAVVFPGPSGTTSNQVASGLGTVESTWRGINVTAMMRDALAGQPIYGLLLTAWDGSGESNSASNVGEIYSRDAGSAAYIAFDYDTNTPPTAPTNLAPDGGTVVTSQTPTLTFTPHDPQANAHTAYRYQVALDSGFASVYEDVTVSGSFTDNVAINRVVTNTEARGTTYYWRVQTVDAGGVYGPWSGVSYFKVASLPTVTVSDPPGAGRLGHLWYVAGSGWTSPRLEVDWALSCPDGGSQYSYRVEVQADNAGSPLGTYVGGDDSTTLVDPSTTQRIVPIALTEGNYYHVQVTATCSHGLSQTVAWRRVRVRWGVVTHRFDMGAPTGSLALTVLDVTDETTGGAGRVVVEYQTTATTAAPGAWSGTIGGAGLLQYLWYRTWLLAWGASPAVSPTLNEIKITYTTATISPDKWVMLDPTNESGDVAAYVYGTKSLRMKGKGSAHAVTQAIPVAPNTYYMVSGRIQSVGVNTGAYIGLATAAAGPDVVGATTPPQNAATGFEAPASRVQFAVPWFSGNNTQMYVRCVMSGAVGTTAWFDAIKVEASTVVTPWTPGYVANAVVLDAGGLQIDAFNGGLFRLRGSAGGVRDTVDLGANGLVFGGSEQLSSPAATILQSSGSFRVGSPNVAGGSGIDLGGGAMELVANAGTPLIDFKADATVDFDTRVWNPDRFTLEVVAAIFKNVGLHRKGGAAFPTVGRTTGDTFYRTDLNMEFFWDGSRWVSTQLFQMGFVANNVGNTTLTATGAAFVGPVPTKAGMSDIVFTEFMVEWIVASGGTALGASHNWMTYIVGRYGNTAGSNTSGYFTLQANSGASDTWRRDTFAIYTLVGSTPYALAWYWTKTGTPGNLSAVCLLSYRYVAV